MIDKKLITIITPVFNESDNINWYYNKIIPILDKLTTKYDFEIIFTDNASTDNTVELCKKLITKDDRFHLYCLSKNYGYQKSIFTGYLMSKGDAVIEFDCDLQDPPELLEGFLKHWEEGNQIIYGIRAERQEGWFITFLRKCFYKTINVISKTQLPENAGDFMLIDRQVVNQLTKVDDHDLYIRGIVFGFGFKQIGVSYARNARMNGESKFSFSKLISFAVDGVISQSTMPLRVATYTGGIVATITMLTSFYFIFLKLLYGIALPAGFTLTIVLILFSVSLNALFFGIIGEYVARIYTQIKKRPMTIVSDYYGKGNRL